MPARQRAPRKNPLIPVTESTNLPQIEQVSPAPICGQCFPSGWPEGGDYASCPHGDWSTRGGVYTGTSPLIKGDSAPGWPNGLPPAVIRGITTDGIPVAIELRGDEPALVSLTRIPMTAVNAKLKASFTATDLEQYWPERPAETVVERLSASPFAPAAAPAPVEIEPEELDTGDDVMFMPSGG